MRPQYRISTRSELREEIEYLEDENFKLRQDLNRIQGEQQKNDKCREAIPMLLWCPECKQRHVDAGEFVTKLHHTHACQFCGHVWRPAVIATVGVRFLPGFKDEEGDANGDAS